MINQDQKITLQSIKAFTLAEVLITLAVVGVVAAMAIPSLQTNINEKQYKVAWAKGFANISHAYVSLKQKTEAPLMSISEGKMTVQYLLFHCL